MSKRLLLLTPMPAGSGNRATAHRLRKILSAFFSEIYLEDAQQWSSFAQIGPLLSQRQISAIFCIHAYHSGRLFINSHLAIPLVTIFGGTDLHSPKHEWRHAIDNSIRLSAFLVCFNETMRDICLNNWPDAQQKCVVIPQGVHVDPDRNFALKSANIRQRVISWVGSIRAVKDPLFIEPILGAIRDFDENMLLVYAGFSLDDALVQRVHDIERENENFRYIGGLSCEAAHALIESSWAFLNTSVNEGMSLCILEAMKMSVPVMARDNFGNCSVVSHRSSGLLFSSPSELLECIREISGDDSLRNLIVKNALSHVDGRHSLLFEQKSYEMCLKKLGL